MYEGIDFTKVIAVSNRHLSRLPYLAQVERILRLHPKAFLLREKDLGEEEYRKLAQQVKELCDQYQVELTPHFYPASAEALGCGAVHLPLWKYRETSDLYGLRVGVSVHAVEEAKEAVGLGASYLTAGHVFATDCKKGLAPRGLPFLKEVCDVAKVPVYGIGGIGPDPEQIRQTLEQGAAGVCIMSGMMRI